MGSLFPELDRRPPVDPYAAEERAAIQELEAEEEREHLAQLEEVRRA